MHSLGHTNQHPLEADNHIFKKERAILDKEKRALYSGYKKPQQEMIDLKRTRQSIGTLFRELGRRTKHIGPSQHLSQRCSLTADANSILLPPEALGQCRQQAVSAYTETACQIHLYIMIAAVITRSRITPAAILKIETI